MIEIAKGDKRARIKPAALRVWRTQGWVPVEELPQSEPQSEPQAQTSLDLGQGDVPANGESEQASAPIAEERE